MQLAQNWIDLNKSILKNKDIKWFDKVGIFPIDANTIAEIQLWGGSTDSWTHYIVTIISKVTGNKLASHHFYFNDWCERNCRGEKPQSSMLHIWRSDFKSKPDWYIDRPKDTKSLEKAIFDYIKMFKVDD
jgi:hypothetical protein